MSDPIKNQTASGTEMLPSLPLTEVLGVLAGSPAERLVADPEVVAGVIATMAQDVITNYSRLEEVNGAMCRVSLGNEHLMRQPGKIDAAFLDNPEFLGFRLIQEVNPNHQDLIPIKILFSGNTRRPRATINAVTGSVHDFDDITPTADLEHLTTYLQLVGTIKEDSVARKRDQDKAEAVALEERRREKTERNRKNKRKLRRYGGALLAVAALGFFGPGIYQAGTDKWNDRQAAQAQQQAEESARDRAAREVREDKVRAFDLKYDVESVPSVVTGIAGVAASSEQFRDVTVPEYGTDSISERLAETTTEPRSVSVENLTDPETDKQCKKVDYPSSVGEKFYVAQNGDPASAMVFHLDPETDKLELCYFGTMGEDAITPPTEVIIQKAPIG